MTNEPTTPTESAASIETVRQAGQTLARRVAQLEAENGRLRRDLSRLTTPELPDDIHAAMCFFEFHGVFFESQCGPAKAAGEHGLVLGRNAEKTNIQLAAVERFVELSDSGVFMTCDGGTRTCVTLKCRDLKHAQMVHSALIDLVNASRD